ncbi:efflux RND transporter periplasmic adaptor subunit [Acidiphilium sp.]|uniref:efflux RND transporter periplasmic adaptor subunit n=1 Tax=Acidiphilium sp. TaxID=527 RepID=UPI003D05AB61
MKRRLLAALLLVPVAQAAPAPSVLVTTIPVKTGAIPRSIAAYGTIGAAPGASDTITIDAAGFLSTLDVMPGQAVRRGQALAVIGIAPSAQAAYAQAEAAVRAAVATLAHTSALVAAHLATTIQLAQAEQAEQAAISTRDALRLEGADRATTTLVAPHDGVIATVAVAPGAALTPGAPILTLIRTDVLVATIGLDPLEANQIHPGDPVALMKPGHAGHAVNGKVAAISAMVNPQSGLVDATISLPPKGFLLGETISAEIDIGTVRGIIVPRDAALPDGRYFQLWQIDHGHARPVRVSIVTSTANSAVVAGRINPALPIVVSGNYQLTPGIAVRVTH